MSRILRTVPFMALMMLAGSALAAGPAQDINWKDLVPRAAAEVQTKPKTFFSGATPADANTPAPPPMAEGNFMQVKRRQPGQGSPPAIVSELNGKNVRIGGYVVPLDFEATKITEFLLVPFVGACIHVPPPPANQIIYVKIAEGVEVGGTFDPVTVSGTIKTDIAFTGLADAGYTIDADLVEPRKE